jgi:hypothetical protein
VLGAAWKSASRARAANEVMKSPAPPGARIRRAPHLNRGHAHMNSHALIGVAALLVAACDAPTAPRSPVASTGTLSAAVVQNDKFDVATFAFNDCTGEAVAVNVTFHFVTAVTADAAGGFHLKQHVNVQGSGTSATGTQYVVSEEDNFELNGSYGVEETEVLHFTLVSKGSAPNEVAQLTFHITVTPNGDVTSYHDNVSIKCG